MKYRPCAPGRRLSLSALLLTCLTVLLTIAALALLTSSANSGRRTQAESGSILEGRSVNSLMKMPDGSLVGTALPYHGGTGNADQGMLFQVTDGDPIALHVFTGEDGAGPAGSILYASDGFIYGVTMAGGGSANGTVYRISPDGSNFEVIHNFRGSDGSAPCAGLIEDGSGHFYGTASAGGSGEGTVFGFSTDRGFVLLHAFSGNDGAKPMGALILGQDGLLYGSTQGGGTKGKGVLFRLGIEGSAFQILHSFSGADGARPSCGLVQAGDGSLFGAAASGGMGRNGVVFKLATDGSDFTIEHVFTGYNSAEPLESDGAKPISIQSGGDGFLYGVTSAGGKNNLGVIYQLDPLTGQLELVSSNQDHRASTASLVVGVGGPYHTSLSSGTIKLQALAGKGLSKSKGKGILSPQAIDNVTTNADSGTGSLRVVIAAAASGDTITFAPGLNGETITLTSGEILINKNLTITGPGSGSLSISGDSISRIFFISTGTVNITGLTLENGVAQGGNGGSSNLGGGGGGAAGMGGAIFVNNAKLTLTDVNFDNDQALGGFGGAPSAGSILNGGGGGGIEGNGGNATTPNGGNGGPGGNLGGTGGAGGTSSPTTSGANGGPGAGGGGGGGRTTGGGANGGAAGVFGGGGGGSGAGTAGGTAGNGNFAGGGGGGAVGLTAQQGRAGTGGTFGGNGANGVNSSTPGGGGGGGGLGGAVFIDAGTLTVVSGNYNNNTGSHGSGGGGANNGLGKGGALFINTGVTAKLTGGQVNFSGNIATDQAGTASDNNNIWGAFSCVTGTEVSITAPTSVCPNSTGNTASGPAGESAYSWSITGGTITAGSTSQTVTFTAGPSGSVMLTLTVTDGSGCQGSNTQSVPIGGAVTVTPTTLTDGTEGAPFTPVQFAPSGAAFSVTAGSLPPGMTLSSTGLLSGTPTDTGPFSFTVTATLDGCTGSQGLTLKIDCAVLTESPTSLVAGTAGVAYGPVDFSAMNGFGSIAFSEVGALPAGITLSNQGKLSGTPTATGSFPIQVTATDQNGCTGTESVTLQINCPTIEVSPSALAAGTAGVAYTSVTFTQMNGVGTITFSESGALPTGMNFTNGVLSGTPTQTGTFPITVTATDQNQCKGSVSLSLVIGCPTIVVSPTTLQAGTVDSEYSPVTFTQMNGVGTVTFSLSGTLPPGIGLNNGVLSGFPTEPGTFSFTVTATDQNQCKGSVGLKLQIGCPTISVSPTTLSAGMAGVAYSPVTFTEMNGVAPVTFSESGALPAGMSFSEGVLSGTPTQIGTFPISVTVTDKNMCGTTQSLTLQINCPTITVSPGTIPPAVQEEAYSVQFSEMGAVGAVTFSTSSTLPTGVSLSKSGLLSGTPTEGGMFSITVVVTDANGCTGSRTISMSITALDKCLTDDHSGDYIQFSSVTGDYVFTHCGTGAFTLSGKGVITEPNGVLTITDRESSKSVVISYNTGSLIGTAKITIVPAPGLRETYRINDTNPHPICKCQE